MASTISLKSSDGQDFKVKKTILLSQTIAKKLLQIKLNSDHDHDHDSPLVLDIDGETLEKVIEYCDIHGVAFDSLANEAIVNEAIVSSLHAFDAGFVNVDQTTFFKLIEAAHHLKIQSLMDLTCGTLSKKIKGKNYKEIEALAENWR